MCGIAGVINFSHAEILPRENWAKFADPLKYRGPDDSGNWQHESDLLRLYFFHTRLSIIDLNSTGHQPMLTADEEVAIVFNGEIYNYKLVRAELIGRGFQFRSSSDTEVLLQGYKCWGFEEMLKKIDGMFAIALFDKQKNKLFLARDRFGKKPLYYSKGNQHLIFSSDIRSFKAVPSQDFAIDLHALGYFFAEYGTPEENTIWKQVKKVKPGSFVQFDSEGTSEYKNYWRLNYTTDCSLDHHSIVEKTDALIANGVKKRLVADVNVSALLSGGIDSSLMVAKMAELSSGKVKTYSVGFKEEAFNELPFARQVADRFNTDHTELVIDPQRLHNIDDLILEYGEPFADSSMIPSYLMSREISKSEKVVLGGDGGDELFGGYDSYYFAYKYDSVKSFGSFYPLAQLAARIYPSYRTRFLARLLGQSLLPDYTLLHRHFAFDKNGLKCLIDEEIFYNALDSEHQSVWRANSRSSSDLINLLSGSLHTRLVNDYLVKVDRASMFASLEMRSPYLDKDLAEFAATLKPGQIFHRGEPKAVLKDIASKYFPKNFVYRKKMGFGIPIGNWFKKELNSRLKEVLREKQKLVDLDYRFVDQLVDEHTRGTKDHTDKVWALYVFHIWANQQ